MISAAGRGTKQSSTRAISAFRCVGTPGYSGFLYLDQLFELGNMRFRGAAGVFTGAARQIWRASQERAHTVAALEKAAVGDFYLAFTTFDSIPYWDTSASGLAMLEAPYVKDSDPANDVARRQLPAAIAAHGLLRSAPDLTANTAQA